jgi:hypothetical protein
MHGTFRAQVTGGAVTTVRFAAPAAAPSGRPWRSTMAALLAGCCLAVLPGAPRIITPPSQSLARAKPEPAPRVIAPAAMVPHRTTRPVAQRPARPRPAHADGALIRIALPEPTPVTVDVPSPTLPASAAPAQATPARAETPPDTRPSAKTPAATRLAATDLPPPTPAAPAGLGLRPVDIAQISDSEVRSLNVPQLRERGLAAGAPDLTARIAAMQVTPLPPVRLRDSDRAALLAEAPTRMTVRIAGAALGQVDFRMSDARTIDVSLGNLLDLLAGHYDAGEFARLRTSAAADAYVSFDQLRALGLNVRYDPVYDELRISG